MNTVKNYTTIRRCVGSYNDLSNKVCFPSKTEDLTRFKFL